MYHYQPCMLVWGITIGHGFCSGASLSAVSVGVVHHYRSCLLVCCLTVSHACWNGASLKAMPSRMVPHYSRPSLLVWYLTIVGHACWCGTSLSAMPVCVVPYYSPCLCAWCLACCSIASATAILQAECRCKKDGYKYGAT